MYQFARCQSHPKYPELQGWYLVLKPDDCDTLEKLHKGVAGFYYGKFGKDPHIVKSDFAGICNPIRLAGKWLATVMKHLVTGETLVVNSKGGWLTYDSVQVLATQTSDDMRWPTLYKAETITISRWPRGRHYYLSSNRDRIFYPLKYLQYADALAEAKVYTNTVKSKGC